MNEAIPSCRRQGRKVTVANEYWEVVHDADQGGCPVSLVFRNGSRRNFFVRPPQAHIAVNEPGSWATFYRQAHCRKAAIGIARKEDRLELTLRGFFASEAGRRLPVDYEQTYVYYGFGMVRVRLTIKVKRPLRNCVVEFSPCSFYVSGKTNMFGVRPAGYSGAIPPEPAVEWREVTYRRSYADRRPPSLNYPPLYFCMTEQGVEGLEYYRGADYAPWETPFGLEAGGAVFRANPVPRGTPFFGAERDAFYVENNLICKWGDFASIPAGPAAFEFTLGLPFVKPRQEARRHVFHALVQPRPAWPDFRRLKKLADSGVTLLRLHDDNTAVTPSWADGRYPPYPPEVMRGMDEMIANAHRLGMKIVPYFSLKEFHRSCPEYRRNAPVWKRQSTRDAAKIDGEYGIYGGYMCMASDWLEFRKQSIDLVLRKHAFDGLYFDHTWPRVCRNARHMRGHVHTDMDQVLDFLRWSRARVGPDGVVFLHNSATPTMIGENLADLVYLGEHTDPSIPLPGRMSPDMEFIPIAPRNGILMGPWKSEEEGILAHLLEGWPVTAIGMEDSKANDFALAEYRRLSGYGLDRYRFLRAGERPVATSPEAVYASLYHRRGHAVVYAANLSDRRVVAVLRPDLVAVGWKPSARVTVTTPRGAAQLPLERLQAEGVRVALPPFGAAVVECRS